MIRRMIPFLTLITLLICSLPSIAGEIHRAVEAGDVALVQKLVQANPDLVSAEDDSQFQDLPIHIAVGSGNIEIVQILLEAGAYIDAGDSDNSTPLGVAAIRRQSEMVTFLIAQGADVNRRDRKGDYPLSFAAYGTDEAIIQQLLDAGADIFFRNPNGETLMHVAAGRGLTQFTEYLLEHGNDFDARTGDGVTPLAYACRRGHIEIVQMLIDKGADVDPSNDQNASPMDMCMWENRVEAARLLLQNGAEVDKRGWNNRTTLFTAANHASVEMVNLMLEQGADVNHRSDDGTTALVGVAASGQADKVQALLNAGADPNLGIDNSGRTALQVASLGGHLETCQLLLNEGAKADAATPTGETPLYFAQYYSHADVAELLISSGARNSGTKSADRSLAALGDIDQQEAVIWFLNHSGWAVKTSNHTLVFDYFAEGAEPTAPGLSNGHINPAEIADQKVAVFATHHHGDHFDPVIFSWAEQVSDITYFLGLEPQEAPDYHRLTARQEQKFDDLELTVIHSTDAGIGLVVEVDGLTIFHPGDHANGNDVMMAEYTDEIDFLADKNLDIDIAFGPIRGCSLGTPDQVKAGNDYLLAKLQPKVFIPMHGGTNGQIYQEFIEDCQDRFRAIQMVAPGNRGDHFVYRNGLIEDPKGTDPLHVRRDDAPDQADSEQETGSGSSQ